MTRARPGDPEYPSDKFEAALRFGCGAVFGLAVGVVLYLLAPEEYRPLVLVGGVGLVVGCGLLSAWLRRGFWVGLRDILRGFR